jgi:amino acid transporter
MTSQPAQQKLSLFALPPMVVGSMVGSGIFSLPRTVGLATGPFGAIIARCIAGGGSSSSAPISPIPFLLMLNLTSVISADSFLPDGDLRPYDRLKLSWS